MLVGSLKSGPHVSVPVQPALVTGLQLVMEGSPFMSMPASISPASPGVNATQLPIDGSGEGMVHAKFAGPPPDPSPPPAPPPPTALVPPVPTVVEVVVLALVDVLVVPPVPLPLFPLLEQPTNAMSPEVRAPTMKRPTLRMLCSLDWLVSASARLDRERPPWAHYAFSGRGDRRLS